MLATTPHLVSPGDPQYSKIWDLVSERIEVWHRIVFKFFAVGFMLSIFGRPKVIAPIMVSAIGLTLFWIFSTAL
jgi:hypothetical protein